jgi:hypothetical protein
MTTNNQYDGADFIDYVNAESLLFLTAVQDILNEDEHQINQDHECLTDSLMSPNKTSLLAGVLKHSKGNMEAAMEDLRHLRYLHLCQLVFIENLMVCADEFLEDEDTVAAAV